LTHGTLIYVLTSGNDQWVRVWEVVLHLDGVGNDGNVLDIRRVGRIKTSVADVSGMAVLSKVEEDGEGKGVAKVLICGVGMEVLRVEWEEM
jgi:hypothetical protein